MTDNFHLDDFTTAHYRDLLELAKSKYKFIRYSEIDTAREPYILWRHDCDYSMNRSYRLAQIEADAGVCSTYFINPHCEFYNPFEKSQITLINKIKALGHDIGLHFDSAFYDVQREDQLDELIKKEYALLRDYLGCDVYAFSFHNPNEQMLACQAFRYGGLVNCYASFFRDEVGYCSDSNGYWRYRRLHDVLAADAVPRLQILTHPGWWQEQPMLPRERISRAAFGRAQAVMADYDAAMERLGRKNIGVEKA